MVLALLSKTDARIDLFHLVRAGDAGVILDMEVAEKIEIWRSAMKSAMLKDADMVRAKMKANMKAGQQQVALRQLQL